MFSFDSDPYEEDPIIEILDDSNYRIRKVEHFATIKHLSHDELDILLKEASNAPSMDELSAPALGALIKHIIKEKFIPKDKLEFCLEDINKEMLEMVNDYILYDMSNAGLLDYTFDENGEVVFNITAEGIKAVRENHIPNESDFEDTDDGWYDDEEESNEDW